MEKEHGIYSSERMVAYCDAIYAIATTLLIFQIRVPDRAQDKNLLLQLWHEWPEFVSFLISFMIISVVWFNHHTMFHYIKSVDHTLTIENLLLMLDVIVIPLCSSLLGEYAAGGYQNAKIATLIYGGWITLGGIPFNLIWNHALRHRHLLHDGFNEHDLHNIRRHYSRGPILYLAVTLLSFINAWLSICGFAVLILLYFVPATRWLRTRTGGRT